MHLMDKLGASVRLKTLWPICGFVLLLASDPAYSYQPDSVIGGRQPVSWLYADRGSVSLDEAVSRVRRQTNGKILSAETVRIKGRPVHVIKVLTPDGRVKRVRIDARSSGG
jgi:uncharacterized membrane protein YkoI